jgi:beta-lactamase superfamily II metal-dependent hydrolase
MRLEVFNVEHGACALITLDDGRRIAIDCGHNSSTGWTLHGHLESLGTDWLDELWLTNLDQDHLSGFAGLLRTTRIGNILLNPSITPEWLHAIKQEVGVVSQDIEALLTLMRAGRVNLPFAPLPAMVSVVYAWNACGVLFDDTNNLSLAAVVSMGSVNVLFPGDLERRGMRGVLQSPLFANAISNLHVLIAPHHGRQNGCSQDLFDAICPTRPQLCIVSDGDIQHESQETHDWYRQRVCGVQMRDGTTRKILTTRRDGRITFDIPAFGLGWVTTEAEQRRLIARALQEASPFRPSLASLSLPALRR